MVQAANSALYSARLRFVEGLPARAQELSSTAERLAQDPTDPEAAGILRRRLHALLASAQVFEEPALSLAVQDLIARLDTTQRSERPFTSEEIDAVSVVVASLPTYVRPTSLPPPAAYSDVRELREQGAELRELRELRDLPLQPATAELMQLPVAGWPLLIDLPLPASDEYTPPVLLDTGAALESQGDELDVLIDWTALSQGTAESLPPIDPHALAEADVSTALPEAEEQELSALLPALEPRPVELAEDDATDPGLGPPVMLEQTVSGLLPTARAAVVLLVGDPQLAADLSLAAAEVELVHARSPDEAVRLLHETSPDLVLISVELATQPGADLVRRLKSDPLTPAPDVRVLLPEAATHDQAFVEQTGADGVVCQPLTAAVLEPLLQGAAKQRRFGLRESTVDDIAAQIAEELRRGIAESLREGRRAGDGSGLMAAAWSAIGRVRSHLAEQSRDRVRRHDDDERSLLPPPADQALHPAQLLAGCRVLVADDDPAVLWFFVGLLREASAIVFQAHNGREALELARRKQPHVIVSDILMPKLDGFGLCRELKRDALLARVPVVLLSWKDDLLQRMRELEAGAAGYLRKEAGSQQILSVVCDVLAPRTLLAAQLRAPGEVRGTLEPLGVWTLLELVGAFRPDAHIVVRDSWSMFEVDVRSGRRLAVTRTAADGAFTRGDKALMQLLGLAAGEFEVCTSNAPLRAALNEPLDRALVAAGRRLSALLDSVSDARLLRVSLLAFDDEVLQSLLAAPRTRMHEVVALFRTGNATAEGVLREGRFAPGELEEYLRALARGLAITGVWSAEGEDLVAAAQRERETPQLALLTSSAPPKAAQVERDTPVMAIEPIRFEEAVASSQGWERGDDTLIGLARPPQAPGAELVQAHADERERQERAADAAVGGEEAEAAQALGKRTERGLGPPSEEPAEVAVASQASDVVDSVPAAERQSQEEPLVGRRDRAEGLRLMATLFGLAAVGYFGWQQLTLRQPHELRPAPLETATEAVSVPAANGANRVAAEPALPNTQLGRVLPFVDHTRGVEVADDQGLLVLEYQGTDPAPSVRVGERELGRPPLAVALPVGRHELVVRAGKSTSFRYLVVRAGETRIVSLPLSEL